jgi:ribosomal protein L15E
MTRPMEGRGSGGLGLAGWSEDRSLHVSGQTRAARRAAVLVCLRTRSERVK